MGMLSERLPETVIVGGVEVGIETDFRTSILFEELLNDPELSNLQKVMQAVEMFYGAQLISWEDREEAIEKILWFYNGETQKAERKDGEEADEVETTDALYSFEYDADKIFAAFQHDYGIDLQSIDYLHWWKFKALFKGLSEENEIVKIIGYRGMDIDPKLPSSHQDFYRKMKRIHALPAKREEQELQDELEQILLRGGSLKEFLERNGSDE